MKAGGKARLRVAASRHMLLRASHMRPHISCRLAPSYYIRYAHAGWVVIITLLLSYHEYTYAVTTRRHATLLPRHATPPPRRYAGRRRYATIELRYKKAER